MPHMPTTLYAIPDPLDARLDDIESAVAMTDEEFAALDAAVTSLEAQVADIGAGVVVGSGTSRVINVGSAAYGAAGDGVTDDFTAITAAVTALGTGNATLYFPRTANGYYTSKAIVLDGLSNVVVTGLGTVFKFASANLAMTGAPAQGYDSYALNARSAFYVTNCSDISFENLSFEGDSVNTNLITENWGCAVATSGSVQRLRMRNVVQRYGYALVHQLAGSKDSVIDSCYSYGSRGGSRLGDDGKFVNCTFELPLTAGYNRVGDNGSSHAIYFHGSSGNRASVTNCTFRNIRLDGIKVSSGAGSNAVRGFDLSHNKFYNCGYNHDGSAASGTCILVGADDVQTHAGVSISNNQMFECKEAVSCIGATNVQIKNNIVHRVTAPATVSASLISVSQYVSGGGSYGSPLEAIIIEGNSFTSELASGTVYATAGVTVQRAGTGISGRSSAIRIVGNTFSHGLSAAVSVVGGVAPTIADNSFENGLLAVDLVGPRMPQVVRNTVIDPRTQGPVFKYNQVSWPIIKDNASAGQISNTSYHGQADGGNNAAGTSAVLFPLSGFLGRAVPSEGKPEVVFAYGYDWTAGDTLSINGTTLTYGTDFSSFATLVTALNATIGGLTYTAADYGAPWSITTYHIRLRYHVVSTTANLFYVSSNCAKKTAGVVLPNIFGASPNRCFSRGNHADDVVVWSPCAQIGQIPMLRPENAAAATAVDAATPYLVTPSDAAAESGSCATMRLSGIAGTELFQWSL